MRSRVTGPYFDKFADAMRVPSLGVYETMAVISEPHGVSEQFAFAAARILSPPVP
jgi:hypothetical protein